ncbi:MULTISPECIES: tripartite tricarboxylate transporter TctB family protein [Shouchella]|uniref:Tripartite tricarboxylate transporter TctB family protein n=2 Tax=Shouchella TaxID=2893057 RepID=A0ABY7W3C5_9BACI|nr:MULTISPECIES: tripartite tricarboxylate transporter TctB family protein [Shouchella]MED4129326.1 tripartite tricarboxylate transporter TctB family protein [Shouchella miscanthi]WDF02425.1 tripartite tricarboxylate transporter TctB family protein [Shouchella hunanensis]GAF21925.1 tricarboxylate transport protein TctB [Bacillus sp. JCM 19047]
MNKDILNIIFTLFLCIVFGSAAILALGFSRLAQFFPLYVSVAGTILSIIYLIVLLIHYNKNRTEHERISFIKPLRYIGWIVGYIGVIYVFGMFIATSLFILSFLLIETTMVWWKTIISVVCVLVAISTASSLLGVYWPTNILGF